MKLFNNASLLSLALCSTLLLTACNKTETEAPESTTDTVVVTDTDNTASTTKTPVSATGSSDSNVLAKQMAKQSIQAFTTPMTASGSLNATQQACLEQKDENLGVAEIQKYINDTFTAEEVEAMNEAYSSDIMKKINQFSEQQMAIMSGKTVENPIAPPTEEDMKEFQAMFENDPRLQRLQEINKNTDPSQNEFANVIRPVINDEFKRCNIELAI